MIVLEWLFKKFVCFPLSLIMMIGVICIPLWVVILEPIYYFLVNRSWFEDAEYLLYYSIYNKL